MVLGLIKKGGFYYFRAYIPKALIRLLAKLKNKGTKIAVKVA